MTEKSLSDISGNFDAFIFDAYGVFWSGKDFFPDSLETMEQLVKEGKEVCVLSNATQLPETAEKSYAKHSLIKGIDTSAKNRHKITMIGDTAGSDITGAQNAGSLKQLKNLSQANIAAVKNILNNR